MRGSGRALKAAGAGLLRDGVYVLPQPDLSRNIFGEQAQEIRAVAGGAHVRVLSLNQQTPGLTRLGTLVHYLEKDEKDENVRGDRAVRSGFREPPLNAFRAPERRTAVRRRIVLHPAERRRVESIPRRAECF
jgi:hypothetical protein